MSRDDLAGQELDLHPIKRLRKVRHAQYCPSRTSKCVGLSRQRPPILTQCAVQRSIFSKDVEGAPKVAHSFVESLRRAVWASQPLNFGASPSNLPNCSPTSRTFSLAGLVKFQADAGELANSSERKIISLASPSQMQLK